MTTLSLAPLGRKLKLAPFRPLPELNRPVVIKWVARSCRVTEAHATVVAELAFQAVREAA